MRKLFVNIKKELLILSRDLPGLAILFVMPLILLLVITLTQKNALQTVNGTATKVLFIDHDDNDFARLFKTNILKNKGVQLFDNYQGKPLTDSVFSNLISRGNYKAGIIINDSTTELAVERILNNMKGLLEEDGTGKNHDSVNGITVLFDPTISSITRTLVFDAVIMASQGAESGLTTSTLLSNLSDVISTDDPASQEIIDKLRTLEMNNFDDQTIAVSESYPSQTEFSAKPGITQNNVPAFALFAMFFIVIPLAGSLISEKEEGTYSRLMLLPVSKASFLFGKTIAYLAVCTGQFILMVLAGIFVLPLFGLPALDMGTQYFAITLTTFISALSAIGFGLLVGSFASTQNQAAMFGAILVVVMASLGGIFMPVYLMPDGMKFISMFSPLRWAVDSFLELFVKETSLAGISTNLILLSGFYLVSMFIATGRFSIRNDR